LKSKAISKKLKNLEEKETSFCVEKKEEQRNYTVYDHSYSQNRETNTPKLIKETKYSYNCYLKISNNVPIPSRKRQNTNLVANRANTINGD